jgi:phage portal protein BeeE
MRREVALAVGRAMLHLRAAAGIEASRSTAPISDSGHKDRTKLAIGRLTLQLLEAGASRSGKVLTKDPMRRETLAKALGGIFQMDANEDRETMQERIKAEHAQLNRKAMPGGTVISGSKLPEVVRMNRPNENINKRPNLPFGETVLQPRTRI